MADIFISYLSEDIGAAEKLAGALEAQGWSVFWDRRIPAGKRFDDILDEQLQAARCVIVLWSLKSIFSPWVRDEAAVGRDRGILVPAHLDDIIPPFGFRSIQSANLIGWQGDTDQWGFQKLLQAVRAAIEVAEAIEEERQRREQQEAEAKRRAIEEERQRREQQEAEAKRQAAEEGLQVWWADWERQEAERQGPAHLSSRKQWAGLKQALALDREKRTPSVEHFVSDLRGGRMASLQPTLIATGIVAIFIAAAGVGYTLWLRHQQEPVALTSAPLPPEAPRHKDSATTEPKLPPQGLPEAVATIPPPQPPEIPETQPEPPGMVAVERLLSNVRCSALEGVVRDRTLVIDGYLGNRQSLAAVLGPLAQASGGLDVSTDQIREIDPLYCRSLGVLRSFVAANRDRNLSLAVSTAGTDGRFREGDELLLTIKAPEHDSYIYVDYFSLDGNVVHMLPNPTSRDNRLAASGQTTLGDGGPAGSWTVGEPFGTELITMISSPKPLFSKVRQAVEPSAGYLADLDKALAKVGMDAGTAGMDAGTAGIDAEISFIHTEPQS